AWQRGEQPSIAEYLLAGDQVPLLVELVHVELERRVKANEPARVEQYLDRYPALAEDPSVITELLAAEYHHRRLHEPNLALDEYVRRFPEQREELTALVRAR